MKKLYYTISEVASMTGLAQHVLRYWESEFTDLRPKKSRGGSRLYRQADIDLISQIKRLLHEERYTIEGARKSLQDDSGDLDSPVIQTTASSAQDKPLIGLEYIKSELRSILDLLN